VAVLLAKAETSPAPAVEEDGLEVETGLKEEQIEGEAALQEITVGEEPCMGVMGVREETVRHLPSHTFSSFGI
jgi:hypothetical protein